MNRPPPNSVASLAPSHSLASLALLLCFLAAAPTTRADEQAKPADAKPEDIAHFENKIRPILVKHCYSCHAADAKEIGGKLLLDTRDALRKGGESGSPIVPGKPDESLLLQALRYDGLQMPPDAPLPPAVIDDIVEWIKRGAADPRIAMPTPETPLAEKPTTTAQAPELWSLAPVRKPQQPAVSDTAWPRHPIDHFVLARIEAAGRKPSADASPEVLVRRLYHDLLGLPPTLEETQEFAKHFAEKREVAIERLVDQLLSSPRFGERWGRHWLDVARFGESNGNDGLGRNPTFPHAWRYRDYVISAFNDDTPYDQFLAQQIAGDLLPTSSPEERDRNLVATGFLAIGSKPAKAMNNNFDMDVVADQIDVISRGVMGLTVGCARCHDHKFDPIPTRDYYALAGIFSSSETLWGTGAYEGLSSPETDLHVLTATPKLFPPDGFVETVLVLDSNTGKPRPFPKSKWEPGTPLAMGVRDRPAPAHAKIHLKGETGKFGEEVPRGFLSALQLPIDVQVDPAQSGRLQLAQWLTAWKNPLTPRVMVNRIWQQLFGSGIVRTPDDFGIYGEKPTHPELLDYLAARFADEGWSIKRTIRMIVLSRTYQQTSDADQELLSADPENRLLARQTRRRMEAEAIRDAMLLVSGDLNLEPRSGSLIQHRDILMNLTGSLHEPSNHRSVYLCYLRSSPPPELAAFDLPDFITSVGRRDVSVVPGQALHLYNNPFVVTQSQSFAQRLLSQSTDPQSRIRLAWQRALRRDPSPTEIERAQQLIQVTEAELGSADKAWSSLCQALLMTSEFRYVD